MPIDFIPITYLQPATTSESLLFHEGDWQMKSKLITMVLVMLLVVAGCSSSGDKSASSENGKLATINSMMDKGYEMSANQRQTINQLVADGKALAAKGQQAEADKLFDEALAQLEVIAETDRFNKSE
jgi:Tfp pilus assembly protein PilO